MVFAQTGGADSGLRLWHLFVVLLVSWGFIFAAAFYFRSQIALILRRHRWMILLLVPIGGLAGGLAGCALEGTEPVKELTGPMIADHRSAFIFAAALAFFAGGIVIVTAIEGFTAASTINDMAAELEAAKTTAEEAKRREQFASKVNKMFLGVVAQKAERFLSQGAALREMIPNAPHFIPAIHRAHEPSHQCVELLSATWALLEHHLNEHKHSNFRLRIALFYVDRNILKVELSTDGAIPNAVKGPERKGCASHFTINPNRGKSLVVQAAFSQEILIEPDTSVGVANFRTDYRPLHDQHHSKIGSIVAMPLGLKAAQSEPCMRVLCIDTSAQNGFLPQHRDDLEYIRDNLEQRLLIELIQRDAFSEPKPKPKRRGRSGGSTGAGRSGRSEDRGPA